jgi:hypothetical protein
MIVFFMRKLFLITIFLALNGCMTTQEAAMKFDSQPASRLCYDYFNLPDYNIWKHDRRASIVRRNLDCTPYMAKALRDKRVTEGLLSLGQALSTPTTSTGYSTTTGLTKVCYYNGPSGQTAITVPRVSICPITHSHNIAGLTKVCTYNTATGQKALTVSRVSVCPIVYPR